MQVVVQTLNNPQGITHFLANVPHTIEQTLERPTVSSLIRSGAKPQMVEACLAAEIMKTSNALTVGGNLRQGQALEIAVGLIRDYPNESLEDFCLCLRRGLKGIYGDVFRFDVLVINGWFQKYLEEKYHAIETNLMREKDKPYEPIVPNTEIQDNTLTDEVKRQKEKERLKAWLEAIRPVDEKKIPPLTAKDIELEGKEKPKANFHPVTTVSQAIKHALHLEYARRNYDPVTGDKKLNWMPEEEWLSSLSDKEKQTLIQNL
jgi:hypothetical protein